MKTSADENLLTLLNKPSATTDGVVGSVGARKDLQHLPGRKQKRRLEAEMRKKVEKEKLAAVTKKMTKKKFAKKPRVEESAETLFMSLINAGEKLEKHIRSLEDLPLNVTHFTFLSSEFRRTSVNVPVRARIHLGDLVHEVAVPSPQDIPPFCKAYLVQLTMESSGKWPNNFDGIEKLKAAFYLEMQKKLKAECGIVSQASSSSLLANDTFVFRLYIVEDRQINILDRSLKNTETELTKEEQQNILERIRVLKKMIYSRPLLTRYLKNLSLTEVYFGEVCRLVKRWIHWQILGDYIDEEAVEVLVSSLRKPFQSVTDGFGRFLQLLATHDWVTSPIVVNYNDEFTLSDNHEFVEKFRENRPSLPAMVLITPADKIGREWTLNNPKPIILNQLKKIAAQTLNAHNDLSHPKVFQCDVTKFDLIIQTADIWRKTVKRSEIRPSLGIPVVDFSPIQCLVDDLTEAYGHLCLLFFNRHNPKDIYVLWKPAAKRFVSPSIDEGDGRIMDLDDNGREIMRTNISAVVRGMRLIGSDMIVNVKSL